MQNECSDENVPQCPKLRNCPFFNAFGDTCQSLTNKLKENYCLSDNSRCARYYLSHILGGDLVPVSMMPHQWEWAKQMLIDAGKISAIRDIEHFGNE